MPKKVTQYQVGYETYNTRWAAEAVASLIQDSYFYNDYLYLTTFIDGFCIHFEPNYDEIIRNGEQPWDHSEKTTITVKDPNTIEVIQYKSTATSEEVLTLLKKGWTYTYDGKNIYNIPVQNNLTDTIKEVINYFIKPLYVDPQSHSIEITEKVLYKAHGHLFSTKNLAHIFEDAVLQKEFIVESEPNELSLTWLAKAIHITITNNQIKIKTELTESKLCRQLTYEHILKYDKLGYNWAIDGTHSIWTTKTNIINRQLFAKVLRDINQLLEKD